MFYYSQFKANKNMQKQQDQHMTDVNYTMPATKNMRGTPAKVAYQVRTGPMTRVTQGAQNIQVLIHDASYYSSVTTEEDVLKVHYS
jgi:ribonuclease BN (tRNA processing enzyme)